MGILQVLPALETGGVERGTLEIAAALTKAGHTALVASEGGRLVPALQRLGAEHVTLPLASKNPLVVHRNVGRLAALIRERGVDLVHARSRAPAWSAWLAAKRTHAHFVTTYHAVYNEDAPGKRHYNAIMARGERVIAISEHIRRHVTATHGTDPARIRVIHRGVDPAVFDPAALTGERVTRLARAWRLTDGHGVLLLPGRLTRWKGHAVLIDAVARLGWRDLALVFPGSDQGRQRYVDSLTQQAEQLALTPKLRLPGECADMPAALAMADVVINASLEPEGFGRTVIEAQAMARPVIAAGHGGAAETIIDGETGWLVPPGDAVALAGKLDHVLRLPAEERQRVGRQARAAVQARFTVRAMQDATLAVYREVMDA